MLKLSHFHAAFAAVASLMIAAVVPAAAEVQSTKDIGPASAGCDRFGKSSAAWTGCVGQALADMPSEEAFYAGYWLAKSGKYDEALRYLTKASDSDPRVLTYIGYSTRQLGDVEGAFQFYNRALALNPDYAVARAYLGDAYLTKGEPVKAKGELAEIERRCGRSCAEYAELSEHIAAFENAAASVTR